MKTLLRPLLLATACTLALPVLATDRCEFTRTESPALDLANVKRVLVDLGADRITVKPGAPSLTVKHCASTAELLAGSVLTIERRDDALQIDTEGDSGYTIQLLGISKYLYREVQLSLPPELAFSLDLGSGDAFIDGLSNVTVDLGSGDVTVREVGVLSADVGSGDLIVEGATSARVEVGSGDIVLKRIQGEVSAEVGSGDLIIGDVGPITALDVGSGDIDVHGVRGDVRGISVGSGDVTLHEVSGSVQIDDIGSGDVVVRSVGGDVLLNDQDDLENLRTQDVTGRVIIGR